MAYKFSENFMLFILTPFALMSVFGISIGMEMMEGQMSSCPLMLNHSAICSMDIMEHIAKWQKLFIGTASPTNSFTPAAAVFLSVILFFFGKLALRFKRLNKFYTLLSVRYNLPFAKTFDYLVIAFSNGILNPKIF